MAEEEALGSDGPAGSQKLLDSLLQNVYDFGETGDETEQKRIKKKRENKKRDLGTKAVLAEESAPPPGSLVRGQRKSASSFFKELREELHITPAVTTTGFLLEAEVAATISPSCLKNNQERVEVVEFHSRNKKRKPRLNQDETTKTKTSVLEKDVNIQEFNFEKVPALKLNLYHYL
ncbi:uncharacterized protein C1orf131-like [Choloepus didactylus]|uniref:uncharacterized protein C1orf131-like n=1 Tax=Choloepus didactylus TaxID=27675 RepID=UPI00189D7147|nr:uncharacterized protein C1orf131-like [Choloepus didactylus]